MARLGVIFDIVAEAEFGALKSMGVRSAHALRELLTKLAKAVTEKRVVDTGKYTRLRQWVSAKRTLRYTQESASRTPGSGMRLIRQRSKSGRYYVRRRK